MKTSLGLVGLFAALIFVVAAGAQDEPAAAVRSAVPLPARCGADQAADASATGDDLGALERAARSDLALAQARLELVLARKALRLHDLPAAARHAQRALSVLKELPAEIDASVYELQAEGILARAAKAGVDLAAGGQVGPQAPPPATDDYLDRQVRAAAELGRHFAGADSDAIDTRGDAQALRERTLRRQVPDRYGYRPGREIIDVEALLEQDRQRLHYEGALREAYKADEARLLVQADEARLAPVGDVAYPDDWPEKVGKRSRYEGGMIARSESWIDKDGREWYVAIYDIQDLIYVPPDFQPAFSMDLAEAERNAGDRQALRWRSGIFGAYDPADLAAGIPLLRYFGGVDDFAARGPKYSVERQRQIVEMIKAFSTQLTESTIIPLEP